VPSVCDSSRCLFRWLSHIKRSEQYVHEYGFATVWKLTWRFSPVFVLNISSQKGHWYSLLLLCTSRLCLCMSLEWLKLLSHSEHLYGFSPVWTLMWVFRFVHTLNALPHTRHMYGLYPAWTLMWLFNSEDRLNALSHMWHLYGLSPVWTFMWLYRPPYWRNALSHMWHLYGLSPVWILMWVFRVVDRLNALSHTWHLYGLSPLWTLLCLTSPTDSLNRLLQTVHSNGFSPVWNRLCVASPLPLMQHLPHSGHLYLLVWIFIWPRRLHRAEKRFPHWLQVYNFFLLCPFLWNVRVCCGENAVDGVHEYCSADKCLLLWTLRLSSR